MAIATRDHNPMKSWKFNTACFAAICIVVWAVGLIQPRHTWQSDIQFLPWLFAFATFQTLAIGRYVASRPQLHGGWQGLACGAVAAALALVLFHLFSLHFKVRESSSDQVISIALLCGTFVLPGIASPRIIFLFVRKNDGAF